MHHHASTATHDIIHATACKYLHGMNDVCIVLEIVSVNNAVDFFLILFCSMLLLAERKDDGYVISEYRQALSNVHFQWEHCKVDLPGVFCHSITTVVYCCGRRFILV